MSVFFPPLSTQLPEEPIVDGHVYMNQGGGWSCLNLKTGKELWSGRGPGQGSIIYADGMLYCLSEDGRMGLIEARPDEFNQVSMFALPEGEGRCWTHPVINDGKLYLRWGDKLHVYDIHNQTRIAATRPLQAQQPMATQKDATGSIRGTVRYEADPQRPWRLGRFYIQNAKTGELAEAVVAISQRGLKGPEENRLPATATIDQKNFQFIPETVAIRAGDHVRFLNSDSDTHNVRSTHPRLSFNVTMPVASEHTKTFSRASGIRQPYQVDCVFHASMRAWVFVFDHPWFALTGKDGAFELKDVPPGEYRLDVVHPAGDLRASEEVRVVAGQEHRVRICLRPSEKSAVK